MHFYFALVLMMSKNWDIRFENGENILFYPHEVFVRFLSRYIKKRIGFDKFESVLAAQEGIRGLDFGCGSGRQSVLMAEFGIEAYGVDISQRAIEISEQMASYFDKKVNFSVYDGKNLEFPDEFFDFTACLGGVLNCIPKSELENIAKELQRITKTYICVSYIQEKIDKNGDTPNLGIEHFDCDIEKLFNKFKLIDKSLFQITENGLTTTSELLIFKNFLEK